MAKDQHHPNEEANTQPVQDMGAAFNKIDTIREILFGQNMQEYDHRFADVRAALELQRQTIEARISEFQAQMIENMAATSHSLNEKLHIQQEYIQKEFQRMDNEKTSRAELGKMLVAIGKQLIEDGRA